MINASIQAVLFDLDGTLAYSAHELGRVANALRQQQHLVAVPLAEYEKYISDGVVAILGFALNLTATHPQFEPLKQRYLQLYAQLISHQPSQLYPQIEQLLRRLNQAKLAWGIVTNKHTQYTELVVKNTPILQSASCVISGDTLKVRKPDPQPLLLAAKQLKASAQYCCYVGDHSRDMQAAAAAKMHGVFASYGYTKLNKAGQSSYKNVINTPLELLELLNL